jgi:type III restriction enzyme
MTERTTIDRLIVNSPYEEPQRFWRYNRENRTFTLVEGERRPAGYVIATESSRSFDDPGQFVEIALVNQIRPRVKAWRETGYPGVTAALSSHRRRLARLPAPCPGSTSGC